MLAAENAVMSTNDVARELMERVRDARRRSDALFDVVRAGSLYERPIPERHRIIFYVGHLEAFDWNLLGRESGLESRLKNVNPEFDRLFALGIDPVGGVGGGRSAIAAHVLRTAAHRPAPDAAARG